jgi:hypothetical protein
LQQLISLYEFENILLQQADSKKFLILQDQKITLSMRYESVMKDLLGAGSELRDLIPAPLKNTIQQLRVQMANIADQNLKALDRMQKTTDKMNDLILLAVRHAASSPNPAYNASGTLYQSMPKTVSVGVRTSA